MLSRDQYYFIALLLIFGVIAGGWAYFNYTSGVAYTPSYTEYAGFQTLSQAQAYAQSMPEDPEADLRDPLDPDYSAFYYASAPSIITQALQLCRVYAQPTWKPEDCAAVLEEVNMRHADEKAQRPVAHLRTQPGTTKLFVWGPLYGAYHSLVRDIKHLHEQGIIDEQLELQSPHYYCIFNGDAIDLSAYSMETLTLLANLILKNPGQVIYLAGPHEQDKYWRNFSLYRQIAAYKQQQQYAIPYTQIIETFFNRLPHALYITTTSDDYHALRISPKGINDSDINVDELGDVFDHTEFYNVYDAATPEPTTRSIDVVSQIKHEPWLYSQRARSGLGLLEQEKGATTWAILSCPVYPYRTYYPFTYDAFTQIDVASEMQKSIIHLYQHPYDSDGTSFIQPASYGIYTTVAEKQIAEEQYENVFNIGSSMGFELNRRVMSAKTRLGISTHLNTVNQNGGIHNNTHLRMYMYNDDYQPKKALDNVQYMIDRGITTLIAPIGTPTLKSYLDRVRHNELLVLFPITGAPDLRKPDLSGVIHLRSSYADEVKALIQYMVKDYNTTSFAFFYQDDAYGLGALRSAREELQKLGIKNWKEVPYVSGGTDFSQQAQEIQQAAPQAIGFFSGPGPMIRLIRSLGIPSLANKYLFAISPVITLESRRFLNLAGLPIIASSVTPNPAVSDLPIAQEYRDVMDELNIQYDKFSFETFIGMNILADAAEQVEGEITRDKIKQVIESYNNYQLKGLTLTFNSQTRSIPLGVWIETPQKQGWHKQI